MALGVYVHIPFCLRRCGYCSFASQADYSLQEAYFARLREEIRSFGQFSGRSVSCDTDGIPTANGGAGESGERKGAREPCGAESCAEADTVYFGGGTPSSFLQTCWRALCGSCTGGFRCRLTRRSPWNATLPL